MKTCNNTAIFSEPDDRAWSVAVGLSRRESLDLIAWSDNHTELDQRYDHAIFISTWERLTKPRLEAFHSRVQAQSHALITAPSIQEIRSLAGRLFSSPKEKVGPGWIMGDESILAHVRCPERLRTLLTDRLALDEVRRQVSQPADFGVIVGHGREDVCYFEKMAICGQRTTCHTAPCDPVACVYRKPKLHADEIRARMILYLSCGAARVGEGLYPPACRLVVSSLAKYPHALLGPLGIFTLSSGIVEVLLEALFSGAPLGVVSKECGSWYQSTYKESNPFVVVGDPTISVGCPARTYGYTKRFIDSSALVDKPSVDATEPQRSVTEYAAYLGIVLERLETLREFGISTEAVDELRCALAGKSETIARLLTVSEGSGEARASLIEFMTRVEEAVDACDCQLADELTRRSQERFFWLSSCYPWRVLVVSRPVQCPICAGDAEEKTYEHRVRPCEARIRYICSRCGIVSDYPSQGVRIAIGSKRVLRQPATRIDLTIKLSGLLPDGPVAVSGAVNGSGKTLKGRLIHRRKAWPCPSSVRPLDSETLCIRWTGERLLSGVHFAHVYGVMCLGVSEASAPIEMAAQLE